MKGKIYDKKETDVMKKKLLLVLALVLAAASLSAAAVLWGQNVRYQKDIVTLTYLVEDLQHKVSSLSGQPASLSFGETTLNARLGSDGLAEVSFTLAPAGSVTTAPTLKILVDDVVAAEAPCQWDGAVYCAQAALYPTNDCTYILDLEGNEYVLASPSNGAYPDLVNLQDSLSAYCNLVLGDWIIEGGRLTLDTCHLQVQAPRLGDAALSENQAVRIQLRHRGDLIEGVTAELPHGEGAASYEGVLNGLSLTLPALEEGDAVDLWMEATLADGQMVSICAGTWTRDAMGWTMAAG